MDETPSDIRMRTIASWHALRAVTSLLCALVLLHPCPASSAQGPEQIMKQLRADAAKFDRFMADFRRAGEVDSDPARVQSAARKLELHGGSVISQGFVAKLVLAGLAEAGPLEKGIQRELAKAKPEEIIARLEKDPSYARRLPGASTVEKAISAELSRIGRSLGKAVQQPEPSKVREEAVAVESGTCGAIATVLEVLVIIVLIVLSVVTFAASGTVVVAILAMIPGLISGAQIAVVPCVESARKAYSHCLKSAGKDIGAIRSCNSAYHHRLKACPK